MHETVINTFSLVPCCQGLSEEEVDGAAAAMMAADDGPGDRDPGTRAEFKEWKLQFKNNLEVAAELYRDRQVSVEATHEFLYCARFFVKSTTVSGVQVSAR